MKKQSRKPARKSAKKAITGSKPKTVKRNQPPKKAAAPPGRAPPAKHARAGSQVSGKAAGRKPIPKPSVKRNQKPFALPKLPSPKTISKSSTASRGSGKTAESGRRRSAKRDFIVSEREIRLAPPQISTETSYPVMNLDGDLMVGVLHEPACKSDTLIIMVHGWQSDKEHGVIRTAAVELARIGYATYRVDLSGNGDSEGRNEDSTPMKVLRDIVGTAEHFRRRYRRIVLLGHSLGGMMAIIAASRIKLDGVVSVAAPMHPEEFDRRLTQQQYEELRSVGFTVMMRRKPVGDIPYTITERFISEMKQSRPLDAAHGVHCPALIVHGSEDRTVPMTESEELLAALYVKDILVIGGADHHFSKPEHLDSLISGVAGWLSRLK